MQPAARSAAFDVLTVTLNPAIDRTVTIHNFAAGEVNRVEQVAQHPGGKGVNVASTLADARHAVAVAGFLGRENSAMFEALFARKQIADMFVRIDGETRAGIKIIDPATQQTTDINFPGFAPTTADQAALFAQLDAVQARWGVLAGSLPPTADPAIYREITTKLKQRGCQVALDTSGDALMLALQAVPKVIKPNIRELETLLGTRLPDTAAVIAAARTLLAQGMELVVVSMGRDGALFVAADAALRAVPPRVTVQSTVGAGDAMVAGVVSARLRGLSLQDTARLATAFSLDAISKIESGLSDPATIEGFAARVTVEDVASET